MQVEALALPRADLEGCVVHGLVEHSQTTHSEAMGKKKDELYTWDEANQSKAVQVDCGSTASHHHCQDSQARAIVFSYIEQDLTALARRGCHLAAKLECDRRVLASPMGWTPSRRETIFVKMNDGFQRCSAMQCAEADQDERWPPDGALEDGIRPRSLATSCFYHLFGVKAGGQKKDQEWPTEDRCFAGTAGAGQGLPVKVAVDVGPV